MGDTCALPTSQSAGRVTQVLSMTPSTVCSWHAARGVWTVSKCAACVMVLIQASSLKVERMTRSATPGLTTMTILLNTCTLSCVPHSATPCADRFSCKIDLRPCTADFAMSVQFKVRRHVLTASPSAVLPMMCSASITETHDVPYLTFRYLAPRGGGGLGSRFSMGPHGASWAPGGSDLEASYLLHISNSFE